MYKHLFFDLDNTLTRSRSKIEAELKTLLSSDLFDVIIVSGAVLKQIAFQVDGLRCYKMGQNGNHAEDPEGGLLWEECLTSAQIEKIHAHIDSIPRTWEVPDINDLVQDRGCQVSYSLLGHNAVLEDKEAFDADSALRTSLLEQYPFSDEELVVKIGGTTCFDYTKQGMHKGHFVAKLIEEKGWKKEECIYFGDKLFPGGNDETVIGVIQTQAVENPSETTLLLKQLSVQS